MAAVRILTGNLFIVKKNFQITPIGYLLKLYIDTVYINFI